MSVSLRLQLDGRVDASGVVGGLAQTLNAPAWPSVDISAAGQSLSFAADTWEPLLRVRVEEALEQILGGPLARVDALAIAAEVRARGANRAYRPRTTRLSGATTSRRAVGMARAQLRPVTRATRPISAGLES
jgi:hypothetical protein